LQLVHTIKHVVQSTAWLFKRAYLLTLKPYLCIADATMAWHADAHQLLGCGN
jgi:hypothetical protein